MKLAVGFITYNETSARYLADFLPSLTAALRFLKPEDYRLYVFDNSSPDDRHNGQAIVEYNRRAGQGHDEFQGGDGSAVETSGAVRPIQYFSSGENQGFGRAYNVLIRQAAQDRAEYVFMINPDTLIEPTAVLELIKALDNDPKLAAVSPKILRWDFLGRRKTETIDSCGLVLKTGLRFKDLGQSEEDRGQFDRMTGAGDILGPSGAAGLFRLSALEKIKEGEQYFDERFFMYREDCDLSFRLYRAGLFARLVPTALIYHDRTAASSGRGLGRALRDRRGKSRQVRLWSHLNEHLIYVKYWKSQNFSGKCFILIRVLSILIFSLILEQFLLKNYPLILKFKGY